MMKGIKVFVAVVSALALATLGTGVAQAKTVPKTTGSVELSGPVQYVSFDAFASSPVKGSVSYTNFEYAAPGSGVWVPESFNLGFGLGSDPTVVATHAMTVTSFDPTSPTSLRFAGTGDSGVGWISTFTGTISGSAFTLQMTEINAGNPTETYALTGSGTIAPDGSLTGTWSDNYGGGRTGTFVSADIGFEALHYVAPVDHVTVTSSDAYFDFTIPTGPLTGVHVFVHVNDGGSPGAGHDTWGHGTSPGSFTNYTVEAGNLTVFP
jgi:hypothetical protein